MESAKEAEGARVAGGVHGSEFYYCRESTEQREYERAGARATMATSRLVPRPGGSPSDWPQLPPAPARRALSTLPFRRAYYPFASLEGSTVALCARWSKVCLPLLPVHCRNSGETLALFEATHFYRRLSERHRRDFVDHTKPRVTRYTRSLLSREKKRVELAISIPRIAPRLFSDTVLRVFYIQIAEKHAFLPDFCE